MRYIYILIIIFSIGVSSDNYNNIDLSENKRNLSNEIFNKLEEEHYLKKIDKNNFNKKYFDAIIERLDENKNLFSEIIFFIFLSTSKISK